MNKKCLIASMCLALSLPLSAQNTLTVPTTITLISVNGEIIEPDMLDFQLEDETISLPNGENQIVFRYQTMIRNAGDFEKYDSSTFISTFTAIDNQLFFTLPEISSRLSALKFDRNQAYNIQAANNEDINLRKDILSSDGISFFRDYEKQINKYNNSGKVASLGAKKGVEPTSHIPKVTIQPEKESLEVTEVEPNQNMEIALKSLFQAADKATQKQFLTWAVQNIK